MKMIKPFSIAALIPVGSGDRSWKALLPRFANLPEGSEIILSAAEPAPKENEFSSPLPCSWIEGRPGRANQLNRAAGKTQCPYLWFIHADSSFEPSALEALTWSLAAKPNAIHYFRLAFDPAANPLMRLNAAGANFRSRWLKMPFGDQSFCLSKSTWLKLGGFDAQAKYGEDHLLVWRARHLGIELVEVDAKMTTSSRKYQRDGWANTTARHVLLTAKQAAPEWIKLMWKKWTAEDQI